MPGLRGVWYAPSRPSNLRRFSSSALSAAISTPWVTVASARIFGLTGLAAGRPAALTAETGVSRVADGAAAFGEGSPVTAVARCARMASALVLMAARISSRLFCCWSIRAPLQVPTPSSAARSDDQTYRAPRAPCTCFRSVSFRFLDGEFEAFCFGSDVEISLLMTFGCKCCLHHQSD